MSEKSTNKINLRVLVECAILIAMGAVLSQIKLFEMPNGGSVTAASMVPFLIISYRHGVGMGLISGFVNALLQMMQGMWAPVAPGIIGWIGEILLDYVLAFALLGLAAAFFAPFAKSKNKTTKAVGIGVSAAICCFIRFLCSFLSGFLVWADIFSDGIGAVTYSLTYNGSYMIPETIITVIVCVLLYLVAPKIFTRDYKI